MATLTRTTTSRISGYPAASLRYDLLMALLGVAFIFGLYLDGWAHNHGRVDNTFFTPWHAVLYSTYALFGLVLVVTQFRNVSLGHRFTRALPRGYGLALVGVLIFGAGGGFDFVWHELFGFEASISILLSPAHLFLATGAFLFVSAPLRSIMMRRETGVGGGSGWRDLAPAIISMTLIVSLFIFFVQYSYYLDYPNYITERRFANDDQLVVLRIFGIYLQTAFISCALLFMLRRWQPPIGTMTFMLTLTTGLFAWMRWEAVGNYPLILIAPIIAGVVIDVLLLVLRPSPSRLLILRGFAFLVPVVMTLAYFGTIMITYRLYWEIHLWLGTVFTSGIAGLMLSYVAFPPTPDLEND